MVAVDIEVLDGAQLVKVFEGPGAYSVVMAWFGGTTVNVFESWEGELSEVDVFNASDHEGKPVGRDDMERNMFSWYATYYGEGGRY